MKPWDGEYKTLAERADPLTTYDTDVVQAWQASRAIIRPRRGHGWREDARIFLTIGFLVGLGIGLALGVVWATSR